MLSVDQKSPGAPDSALSPHVLRLQTSCTSRGSLCTSKFGAYLIGCEVNVAWMEYDVVVCVTGAGTKQLTGHHTCTKCSLRFGSAIHQWFTALVDQNKDQENVAMKGITIWYCIIEGKCLHDRCCVAEAVKAPRCVNQQLMTGLLTNDQEHRITMA